MANFKDFLVSNYQISNIIAGFPSLLDQYIAIEGNSVTNLTSAGNTIIGKAQQLILWKIQKKSLADGGGEFIYNSAAVLDAFVPGRYAKVSATLTPTNRDGNYSENFSIPRITKKKKIQTIFPSIPSGDALDNIRVGINRKEQFFYIRYSHPTDTGMWNLLKLKASIGHLKLVDSYVNTWTGHSAYGRTQKNYIYSETERTLPLSFFEYAYSKTELLDLYDRLNHLARLNYGYIESVNGVSESLKSGTIIYLTLGNLYRDIPAIINKMSFEFDSDLWDIDEFVPMMVKIDMSLTLLYGTTNPNNNSNFYSLNLLTPADGESSTRNATTV